MCTVLIAFVHKNIPLSHQSSFTNSRLNFKTAKAEHKTKCEDEVLCDCTGHKSRILLLREDETLYPFRLGESFDFNLCVCKYVHVCVCTMVSFSGNNPLFKSKDGYGIITMKPPCIIKV
jgi:hypothetical protein